MTDKPENPLAFPSHPPYDEAAEGDAAEICQERYLPDERAKVLRYLSEWLRSQMEGE